MTKILGIDTGTNSLGWAIVEKTAGDYNLLDKGVNIFQEGVKKMRKAKNHQRQQNVQNIGLHVSDITVGNCARYVCFVF